MEKIKITFTNGKKIDAILDDVFYKEGYFTVQGNPPQKIPFDRVTKVVGEDAEDHLPSWKTLYKMSNNPLINQ